MWRWPDFSGLTIFEFINYDKVTFFSQQEHLQIFPTSLPKWNMCVCLWFCVTERPEKCFLLSAWRRKLYRPGTQFFIIWETWIYTHRIFLSVILVSIFILRFMQLFLCSSKFDWQNQFLFSANSFSEELASYWLLTLYVTSFFRWK